MERPGAYLSIYGMQVLNFSSRGGSVEGGSTIPSPYSRKSKFYFRGYTTIIKIINAEALKIMLILWHATHAYSVYPRCHHGWHRVEKCWNLDPPDCLKITFPGLRYSQPPLSLCFLIYILKSLNRKITAHCGIKNIYHVFKILIDGS